jgi:hypothetical protein
MIKTSRFPGAVANVCVGTMLWLNFEFCSAWRAWAVGTGSSVAARIVRLSVVRMARRLRASRGPQMSRSWKPGNRMMPMFFGVVEVEIVATLNIFLFPGVRSSCGAIRYPVFRLEL